MDDKLIVYTNYLTLFVKLLLFSHLRKREIWHNRQLFTRTKQIKTSRKEEEVEKSTRRLFGRLISSMRIIITDLTVSFLLIKGLAYFLWQ